MTSKTFFFIFIPILAIILLAVNLIFAPHNPYQEKDSAFECGFHSFLGQNRTQFSISFFIFALLFLLFDLEILLIYPYVVSAHTNGIYGLAVMLLFFLALTLGFAFELGKNALKIDSRQMVTLNSNNTKNITLHLCNVIYPIGIAGVFSITLVIEPSLLADIDYVLATASSLYSDALNFIPDFKLSGSSSSIDLVKHGFYEMRNIINTSKELLEPLVNSVNSLPGRVVPPYIDKGIPLYLILCHYKHIAIPLLMPLIYLIIKGLIGIADYIVHITRILITNMDFVVRGGRSRYRPVYTMTSSQNQLKQAAKQRQRHARAERDRASNLQGSGDGGDKRNNNNNNNKHSKDFLSFVEWNFNITFIELLLELWTKATNSHYTINYWGPLINPVNTLIMPRLN